MNKLLVTSIIISVASGIGLGFLLGGAGSDPQTSKPTAAQEATPLFYRNPMDPNITSPVPAKDHMGMDYVPVFADDADAGPAGTVKIDPVTTQSMGVRTATATHRDIARRINTVGRIGYNETSIIRLHPKTEGWIEELRVQTTGERIAYDDILLSLYSPQLVATQQEYLLALRNLQQSPGGETSASARSLVDTAKQRLELLDVPAHQLEEIREKREVIRELHIHSPGNGTVINVGARKGQYVTPMTELYFIADLSSVWVYVDIFEDELPWVSVGDEAKMNIRGIPGKEFSGKLTFIYPYADRKTRTVKARLEFSNTDGLLKPDMQANITIMAQPVRHVLVVPSEAIIRSGTREILFVNTAPGRFEPREITVGVSSGGWSRIHSGIKLGAQVVVSGQFLIDSESKLREAAAKMMTDGLVSPDAGMSTATMPEHSAEHHHD